MRLSVPYPLSDAYTAVFIWVLRQRVQMLTRRGLPST